MWREAHVSTVSVFPGWLHVSFECPNCGGRWEGVAAVGVQGCACPHCGAVDEDFVWIPDEDDPNRPDMPHDGCWLTGEIVATGEETDFLRKHVRREYNLVGKLLVLLVIKLVTLIERIG